MSFAYVARFLLVFTALNVACGRARTAPPEEPRPLRQQAPTPGEPKAKNPTKRSPQQMAGESASSRERAEMVEQLWLTPLGKMFRHLLFEDDFVKSPSEQSHAIVDRIYSDVKMTITRMSALDLMIEDLYNTARLTPFAHDRISLLETGLAMKRQFLQSQAAREFLRFTPVFIGIGLGAGSKLIREKSSVLSGDIWEIMKAALLRRNTSVARQALREHATWRDLFSRALFRGYSPWTSYLTFAHLFGTGYLIYYVTRTGSADAMAVQNKIWVYGLQQFVNFDEI